MKYYPASILNNLSRQATGTSFLWVNTYKNHCEEKINFTIAKYQETSSSRVFAYSEGISEVHHLVCGWVGSGRGLWHGWGGGESGCSFFPNSTHRIDADHPPKKRRRIRMDWIRRHLERGSRWRWRSFARFWPRQTTHHLITLVNYCLIFNNFI